jgi:hypothetical protein
MGKEFCMKARRAFLATFLLVFVSLAGTSAFAKGGPNSGTTSNGTPMTADFSTNLLSFSNGVFDDGNPLYEDGLSQVQCYIGVSGKDFDMVTYNTPRTLHYVFDTSSAAWKLSGIPSDFPAVSDFYGVNYYGRYVEMGVGTTAQVHGVLQFYVGKITYELDYQSLAVMRTSQTTWLITSNPGDIPGYPGFYASDQAALNVIRRKSQDSYGTVNMPIRFEVNVK